jgi:two-component system response regulator PilR (NtrC family)
MTIKPSCLVVDDETDLRELIVLTLQRMGIHADSAGDLDDAKYLLKRNSYALCLTDMRLPDGNGLDLVRHINQHYAGLPVAVITAYGSADNAVSALKAGAFDYLTKPISLQHLRPLVQAALRLSKSEPSNSSELTLLGNSAKIQHIRITIEKLSRSQAPVHIKGTVGTGKALAAELIHMNSTREHAPFITLNCSAVDIDAIEALLFGCKKESSSDKPGLFHEANGGTLFIDEITEIPLVTQVKLLRAIQDKKITKLGSSEEDTIDVRLITATSHNMQAAMDNGLFRQDLYYRLNVIELMMPALSEIAEDIPLIANHLLEKRCKALNTVIPSFEPQALQALSQYKFPGNVRELENILERALTLCTHNKISVSDLSLPKPEKAKNTGLEANPDGLPDIALPDYLETIEKQAIMNALEKTGQNKTAAAKLLGVSFRTLRYRLSKLGLSKDQD